MCETGESANNIINEKGLSQISDEGELEKLVDNVISSNPENVEKYKNGKDKLFGFFVGEAMKLSKGKANPKVLNELLKSKLNTQIIQNIYSTNLFIGEMGEWLKPAPC